MNGVQVPARIVQRQAGHADVRRRHHVGDAESAEPRRAADASAAAGAAGGAGRRRRAGAVRRPPPAAPPVEKLGEGVFKIGGNYASLAVDMGDHILVVESGQSDARGTGGDGGGQAGDPEQADPLRRQLAPALRPRRAGSAAAVAEGATILTHRNNEQVLERLLAGPRTLIGDSLSKVANRRTNVVAGVGDRDVRKGTNGKVVELHRVPNEHSDGMLVVYLPAEKVLWTADITVVNPNPAQLGVSRRWSTRRPPEARLQRVDSGPPAEPGSAADEGGCRGGSWRRHEVEEVKGGV